jgi:hypothetical protein
MGEGLARPEGFVGRLESATSIGKMHPNLENEEVLMRSFQYRDRRTGVPTN